MNVGPGLAAWIAAHQATPLGDEFGVGSPWTYSAVPIAIANAQGQTTHALVGWDHGLNAVMEPGAGPVVPAPAPPAPLPTMYDSTSAADIPADAQAIAYYVDGAFAWTKAQVDGFTKATTKLSITVMGGQLAAVCDCETGDLTPDEAAGWIVSYPGNIIYCNLSTAPAVVDAVTRAGMNYPGQWYMWVADWTGTPHLPSVQGAEVIACQYADPATGSGGHYDVSVITQKLVDIFG